MRIARGFPTTANSFAATCSTAPAWRSNPGVDFGRHRASAHVRFAYTIDAAKLEEGIARLARFLQAREGNMRASPP
jgi:bifunctional pyridoxal-dependent enzyme with beta-cystathionase and maltose regulon repressor activities